MPLLVDNLTYYNTEDLSEIFNFAKEHLVNAYFMPTANRVVIDYSSDEVFRLKPDYRLKILTLRIPRKAKLFGSEIEMVAMLSADQPELPDYFTFVVLGWLGGFMPSKLSGTLGDMKQRMAAVDDSSSSYRSRSRREEHNILKVKQFCSSNRVRINNVADKGAVKRRTLSKNKMSYLQNTRRAAWLKRELEYLESRYDEAQVNLGKVKTKVEKAKAYLLQNNVDLKKLAEGEE